MNKFKDFIDGFKQISQIYIEKYENIKSLSPTKKKAKLDDMVFQYTTLAIDNLGMNLISKAIIKKFILKNIPHITQAIFDLIKINIQGITKWTLNNLKIMPPTF